MTVCANQKNSGAIPGYDLADLNRRQAASISVLQEALEAIAANTMDRAARDCANAALKGKGHPWLTT